MLPKRNRVNTKEVDLLFKEGKSVFSPSITFRYIKTNNTETKISFIAPKNVAKLAVKRNLLRRHGYDAIEEYMSQFPLGITGVFVFKRYQDDISILSNEIKTILHKIN